MTFAAALELMIPVAALASLAAVVAEILVKDPKALVEIVTDSRAMAQPTPVTEATGPANTNAGRPSRAA